MVAGGQVIADNEWTEEKELRILSTRLWVCVYVCVRVEGVSGQGCDVVWIRDGFLRRKKIVSKSYTTSFEKELIRDEFFHLRNMSLIIKFKNKKNY